MSGRIRLGMIGGGEGSFIGGVHRIAARLDGKFELVAGAFSSDAEMSRLSGRNLGLAPDRIYDSYASMAKAEAGRPDGVQAVSIVTPNNMHAPPAMEFLKAGIHVICDKPLTADLAEAAHLAEIARESSALFVLTHNYTAYPMVRQMRRMIADGCIGEILMVAVEYIQGWLATPIEKAGSKQAAWRTDPKRAGSGAIGDIGTHAFNLAEFVTNLTVKAVCAQANAFVPGRQVDDNSFMLMRFTSGAQGSLWCSQVAIGEQNALSLRVFGSKGSLKWRQEAPEALQYRQLGKTDRVLVRGADSDEDPMGYQNRVPAGLPEGYLEGFGQLYSDIAELIWARREGRAPSAEAQSLPGIDAGLRGMRFISAALQSSRGDGAWTDI